MTEAQKELHALRVEAGLTTREAARLLDVSPATFDRWQGNNTSNKEIPYCYWMMFQLLTGTHPEFKLEEKGG